MSEENRKINADASSKTGEKAPSSKAGYIIGTVLLIMIAFYIVAYW